MGSNTDVYTINYQIKRQKIVIKEREKVEQSKKMTQIVRFHQHANMLADAMLTC